jgi:hypothetical protein
MASASRRRDEFPMVGAAAKPAIMARPPLPVATIMLLLCR